MYQFGIGAMFGRPTGGNLATPSGPVRFAVIQDVGLDFDQKLVELRGQEKFPNDVAPSDITIKGKAAFGRIDVSVYNSLFFAETITAGVKKIVDGESGTVPGTPYQITVTNGANFVEDLGVNFATDGDELIRVASGPTTGQYSVNESTGVYTFAAADTTKDVRISYLYTDSATGRTLPVVNHIQGYGPTFELLLSQTYQGANGMRLYACRASKMSAPMKRDGYLISDFEFEAYANAAGKVFDWYQVVA